MSREDLDRLLEAEKGAQRAMALWKERAERAVREASSDLERSRDRALADLRAKAVSDTERIREAATVEAAKIKSDGMEIAKGLRTRARSRIGPAVERALGALFG
jgi:cell division septum initiation protein DivIVA